MVCPAGRINRLSIYEVLVTNNSIADIIDIRIDIALANGIKEVGYETQDYRKTA